MRDFGDKVPIAIKGALRVWRVNVRDTPLITGDRLSHAGVR